MKDVGVITYKINDIVHELCRWLTSSNPMSIHSVTPLGFATHVYTSHRLNSGK